MPTIFRLISRQCPGTLQFLALLVWSIMLTGCLDSVGTFIDSPVSGLNYTTPTKSGKTLRNGTFRYKADEEITFSIGDLQLGTTIAKEVMSPIDIVPGAEDETDPMVINICVLLQTIDEDGDLNNGIRISPEIRLIVSNYADFINFDQSTAEFAADPNVAALLAELNAADVFSDPDPRDRPLRDAEDAMEHLQRSLSPRHIVTTSYGDVSGFEATELTWAYYGIPYAQPPVGNLRWKPPIHPQQWSGVRDAIAWPDQAPQNPVYQIYGEGGMSEDCLYLNITAPKNADNLPVMVWFHGGAFTILTNSTKSFNNPDSLPTKGVVLVTVNHRLGPFGYLAHPLLSQESDYGGSGNYGQMDLIAALQWVQENIAAFGGNPTNVTLFGQSGGGGKAISLMASPLAIGLFHKVICQSGPPPSMLSMDLSTAEAKGLNLTKRLGVNTLEQMRAVPWTDIIASDKEAYPDNIAVYGPNIDGFYSTDTLEHLIKDGLFNDVPFMAGATAADVVEGIDITDGFTQQMPWRSDYNSAPQYAYQFSYVPAGWADRGTPAYHGIELVYLFDYPASFVSHQMLGLTGIDTASIGDLNRNGQAGDPTDIFISTGYSTADVAMTQTIMTLWTNFAKNGDPSIPGVLDWPPYTTSSDTFLEIGDVLEIKTGLAEAFAASEK